METLEKKTNSTQDCKINIIKKKSGLPSRSVQPNLSFYRTKSAMPKRVKRVSITQNIKKD